MTNKKWRKKQMKKILKLRTQMLQAAKEDETVGYVCDILAQAAKELKTK